jgi:hypothetical protein
MSNLSRRSFLFCASAALGVWAGVRTTHTQSVEEQVKYKGFARMQYTVRVTGVRDGQRWRVEVDDV